MRARFVASGALECDILGLTACSLLASIVCVALIIPPSVMKQLAGLPRGEMRRLLERLQRIALAPEQRHPNIAPLSGASGSYRLRQGAWRAVFSIEDGDVILDKVAHRREVYR